MPEHELRREQELVDGPKPVYPFGVQRRELLNDEVVDVRLGRDG
jgi:hypothetical protein